MIDNDIFQSVKRSFRRNGVRKTLLLILQYVKIKRSHKPVFKLRFEKFFGDILIRPNTSDFSTFRQVFMNDEYGFEFSEPPHTIVDAGANIGLASLYFAQRFPQAKIFSLEPDRSNFDMLTSNTRLHPQIVPLKYALWDKNMMLEIVDGGHDKWGLQVREAEDNPSRDVQGVNLEYLMTKHNIKQIDLLKIDIEGAEWELFHGNFQQWLPRVKVLVIELHDHLRPGCSAVFNNAIKTIRHRIAHKGENIIIHNLDLN